MRAVLMVLVALLVIDSVFLLLFPARIRQLIEDLSPTEFRIIRMIEGTIAAVAVYFLLAG